jgi:hypothetical protein
MVEVIGQSDTVSLRNLENFVLTIAIESSPLDGRTGDSFDVDTPIKCMSVLSMAYNQLASFVVARKGDDERSELPIRARSIHVGLEEARGCSIYL